MKEVKSRFWDGKNFHYFSLSEVWAGSSHYIRNHLIINGAEQQQYTTRNDATGAELYEGDIIVFKFRTKTSLFEYTGKIIFDQYMWLVETEGGEVFSLNRVHGIQLIGNIFENPNLLQ